MERDTTTTEIAVFGGGCFWCTEAVFTMLRGILSAVPGYTGGTKENPTYEEVSNGTTGHAETVYIEFDAREISFHDLLVVFFATHDPTSLDRQGNDVGTQYRSAIFYTTDEQKRMAEAFIKELNDSNEDGKRVVTALQPFTTFYEAEGYHKNYYDNHKEQPYCALVINPKLTKVQKQFAELLKKNEH